MRKLLIFCFSICFLFTNCGKVQRSPLDGTSKLVFGNVVTPDTAFAYPVPAIGGDIKTIGRKYFTTIWQDTASRKSDFWHAGFNGGTYTFENGIYTENLMYFITPSGIGSKVAFKIEIKNDTLVFNYIPARGSDNIKSTEKYVRLE